MIFYSIIMFAVAVLFFGIATAIARGDVSLIASYHREKVDPEKVEAYGKAFSKPLYGICASLAASGVIDLIGGEDAARAAVWVLFAGLAASIIAIIVVQRRYNGGLF
ncbi:MAG: hypothetical protein Q4D39_03560 [Coriobacteriaceae bacterium]|nr:hypothetical protein [Coriobacteriaceae bacterium]